MGIEGQRKHRHRQDRQRWKDGLDRIEEMTRQFDVKIDRNGNRKIERQNQRKIDKQRYKDRDIFIDRRYEQIEWKRRGDSLLGRQTKVQIASGAGGNRISRDGKIDQNRRDDQIDCEEDRLEWKQKDRDPETQME